MRDGVTLWRRLSLARCKPRITPELHQLEYDLTINPRKKSVNMAKPQIQLESIDIVYKIDQ